MLLLKAKDFGIVQTNLEEKKLVFESRLVRAWMLISVFSLFLYGLVQLINSVIGAGYGFGFGSIVALFGLVPSEYLARNAIFLWGHVIPELGLIARFVGLTLALLTVCLVFARGKTWSDVKGKISLAVFLESLFFLGFLGTIPMLAQDGFVVFAVSYTIQVLLTAPLLWTLSLKVRKGDVLSGQPLKFFGLAFVGYVAAIWVNNILRWVFMATIMGVQFLLTGTPSIAFLNAAVLLSSGLAFALAGFVYLLKRGSNLLTVKLFALSLALVGTHFLIYLVYSVLAGALKSVMLVEIWTVPLLGLGLSIFFAVSKSKEQKNH